MKPTSFPNALLSLRTRNSAAYKGLYALQLKSGASDWRTANQLTFATWHQDRTDIHHIFPVAWCKKSNPPVPPRIYDSIINKTPIDARTNRMIGGSAPSAYLNRLQRDINPEKLNEVLRSHWLDPELLAADQFGECFVERGEAMLGLIGEAMGKPVPPGREIFRNTMQSSGIEQQAAEFDEEAEEHDDVGAWAYQEDIADDD